MRQLERLACTVCDEKDQESLQNQRYGNQQNMQRIFEDNIPLKREDNDKCQ